MNSYLEVKLKEQETVLSAELGVKIRSILFVSFVAGAVLPVGRF
nr:hypothetical protein [Dendronalium sp. ChiSLP03b]